MKKKLISLTDEENKSYLNQEVCYICKKKDLALMMTIKNIVKSEIIVIILENTEELLIIFVN